MGSTDTASPGVQSQPLTPHDLRSLPHTHSPSSCSWRGGAQEGVGVVVPYQSWASSLNFCLVRQSCGLRDGFGHSHTGSPGKGVGTQSNRGICVWA